MGNGTVRQRVRPSSWRRTCLFMETASEELTDAFLLFAIESGLLLNLGRGVSLLHALRPRLAQTGLTLGGISRGALQGFTPTQSGLCAALVRVS